MINFKRFVWNFKVLISAICKRTIILIKSPFVYKNFPLFILSRFKNGTGILKLRCGLNFKFRCKNDDRSTISEIFILEIYNKYTINETDIIVDAGANIGEFTLLAASQAKKGMVYAIEPNKEANELLLANIASNNLTNVKTFDVALDSKDGIRNFYISHGTNSNFFYKTRDDKNILVKTITLKHFIENNAIKKIDLLKMDIEGAEFDVLMNTSKEELRKIYKIILEFHNISDGKNDKKLKYFLEKNGFQVESTSIVPWNGLLFARQQ